MKKYICEGVGTMLLTLIACGVAVIYGNVLATSLAFGLVIVAAAYSIGNVSGCHINPAVSIALCVAGKMEVKECIKYVISQIIGAFAGSLLLAACLKSFESLGANTFDGTNVNMWTALLVEVILTFIFTTTILGVTDKKENGHVTGTSVNPARSIAPAVLQAVKDVAALKQLWVFIVAPSVGAIIAGLFYTYVLKSDKKSK